MPLLERVLLREFGGWKADPFQSAMDLERSFGPAYARGVLHKGQQAWAVVGVNAEETPATVDGVLTIGILWLHLCRERAGGKRLFQGLRLIVPAGMGLVTLSRLAWMRADAAKWELYELDERTEELTERDPADTGNLSTKLLHAPDPERARERFAAALSRVMDLVPAAAAESVEARLRSANEMGVLLHGLEFARIRQRLAVNSFAPVSEITFGTGANETPLESGTEPMLRELVAQLFTRRHASGSPKDVLYRMAPEAWLESALRRNIGPLTDGQGSLAQFDPDARVCAGAGVSGGGSWHARPVDGDRRRTAGRAGIEGERGHALCAAGAGLLDARALAPHADSRRFDGIGCVPTARLLQWSAA